MTDVEEPEYPMFDEYTDALEIGFKDNLVISLKRLATFKTVLGIIAAIISMAIIVFLIDFLNQKLSEIGTSITLPLLALLMLSIPAWTISFANNVSVQKKKKLNASGTSGILGRYVGSLIAGAIIMTVIYAIVIGTWYYINSNTDISLVNSYIIMLSFVALACAMTMFCNTIFKRGGTVSYLLIFILVPIVAFLIGPYLGIVTMDQASSALPLVDAISASAADGFGGGTILTLTFLVKASPPLTPDVMGSVVLSIGWAILFIALTIAMQHRREVKHEQ